MHLIYIHICAPVTLYGIHKLAAFAFVDKFPFHQAGIWLLMAPALKDLTFMMSCLFCGSELNDIANDIAKSYL